MTKYEMGRGKLFGQSKRNGHVLYRPTCSELRNRQSSVVDSTPHAQSAEIVGWDLF